MAGDDKIIVDDALISTDVDRMIRVISEKKKVQVRELRRLARIDDERNVEKWIRVLEDEGYINVEYGITGTYIVWNGSTSASDDLKGVRYDRHAQRKEIRSASAYEDESQESESNGSENEAPVESEDSVPEEEPLSDQKSEPASYDSAGTHSSEVSDEFGAELEFPGYKEEDITDDYSSDSESAEGDVKSQDDTEKNEDNEILSDLSEHDNKSETQDPQPEEVVEDDVEEPEDLIERYISSRKPGMNQSEKSAMKKHILENLDNTSEDSENTKSADNPSSVHPDDDGDLARAEFSGLKQEPELLETDDSEPKQVGQKLQKHSAFSDLSSRELMSAYLQEINNEKANIERLKKERDKLYREKLVNLESRMEADLATLTHYVLERQAKITEIKENILELPDKIDEVEKLQERMNRLESEGKEALSRTTGRVNGYLKALKESKDSIAARIERSKSDIAAEKAKLRDLQSLGSSIDDQTNRIRESAEQTQAKLGELSQGMKTMLEDLENATEMKVEISDMSTTLENQLSEREAEIGSLEVDLEEIGKIEHWALEYLGDYEKKLNDIEEYVSGSDEELASVKAAAEAAYIKKYLRQLEDMTDAYGSELSGTLSEEASIEDQISESKKRMREMVKESQRVVENLQKHSGDIPDFEILRNRAKQKAGEARKTVQEKAKEREKLLEDIKKRKARKSGKKKKK